MSAARCGRINLTSCVRYKCVHHSRARSLLAAAELFWRRWAIRYESLVDAFISPSRYLSRLIAAETFVKTAIHILPNAVPSRPYAGDASTGEAFVYAGRLAHEKGLPTLLQAASLARVPSWSPARGPWRVSCRTALRRT